MGKEIIYMVFNCEDAEVAKRFVRHYSVDIPFYYLIVLTPEGILGRDIEGSYEIKNY